MKQYNLNMSSEDNGILEDFTYKMILFKTKVDFIRNFYLGFVYS